MRRDTMVCDEERKRKKDRQIAGDVEHRETKRGRDRKRVQ